MGANSTPRTVHFYLVDTAGKEYLAAVGEAQVESSNHEFSYKFTEAFCEPYGPERPLYNRHNVYEWLRTFILKSGGWGEGVMGGIHAGQRPGAPGSRVYIKHDHTYASLATSAHA